MGHWSGFHKRPLDDRLRLVAEHAGLDDDAVAVLRAPSALSDELAQSFIENAVGGFSVPLGFAVGFDIDGDDVVVPMAVEESSVVAAASHGAKLAGRFTTAASEPITIGQIEVRGAKEDPDETLAAHGDTWIEQANALIPSMVARGGGVRGFQVRTLAPGHVVVHIHVDCRDAMGANVVNTLCEALARDVAEALGGRPGLRILSNLADRRTASASFEAPLDRFGWDVAEAIVAANDLARLDPYRAATHNKGIMNGIDPVLIATGNDWRAVEAGAHAWAARDGQYRGLTEYRIEDDRLIGRLELPLSVGTVGGVTGLHPTAQACLSVLGRPDARHLARICAAVGLAQNLSALRALATEGIQAGHMALHEANARLRSRRTPEA